MSELETLLLYAAHESREHRQQAVHRPPNFADGKPCPKPAPEKGRDGKS
jgi:hypothetical protein